MIDPWELLARAQVAALGTVGPKGWPHQVPVTFAVGDGRIVTMVDWKPKTGRRLQRLANIEANSHVSLMAHHYEDDWARLWWVRVDGEARVVTDGPEWEAAQAALVAKYGQYRERPPDGPVIAITPGKIVAWAAS